ncbi:integral membrane protein [Streptococcus oralis]|uniref:Integral membrane protein n=1 Tax=Streptococcus oralis TaxID=1303 RepID=A0A3R9MQT9_STROR|nr:TIGR02206 family membrane protein [Streptococcus oralis]RSK10244.1 integral membrane protein [Streptococcus oralis]
MNLWEQLFTTQISEPPQFELHWYIGLLCLLVLTFYASYRFRDKVTYQRFIQILQSLQLIVLYSWYWGNQMPLSESLPFYHCRIAMFVMLLIPGTSKYKQYFALLGTFGATAALAYPLFDPYPFPHVTILSFIIGHVALLGNALLYLFKNYEASLLNLKNVTVITFSLNALIGVVNLVVGGDYGFLNKPPLVGNHGLLANYLIVSSVLVAAISLTAKVVEVFLQQRAEKMIQEKA